MEDLVVRTAAQRSDESDIVVDVLEYVDTQERVEVYVLIQHVGVDIVYAFALPASRQREGLLRHLIADKGTIGQESLELHDDLAGAAADFRDPRGAEVISAKDVVNLSGFPR